MSKEKYLNYCEIKGCKLLAESIKLFGIELCVIHQQKIDKWLAEKGYSRELPL